MNVTHESVRRGLTVIAQRLGVVLSDGIVEWLRSIYADERSRPSWLLPPDQWEDLSQHLEARGQVWPGHAGILVGEEGEDTFIVLCDDKRTLAGKVTRLPVDEIRVAPEIEEREEQRQAASEWVSHPKFGSGEIVEHLEHDRVRVRFGDVVKTMLKDRLTPAPASKARTAPPKTTARVEPVPESALLRRYASGAHLEVYEELCRERATDDIALGVAREMMRRVRRNAEMLAERWRKLGFELRRPFAAQAQPLTTETKLPPTLRAFYEEVGFLDFVEPPPARGEWPDATELDALQVLPARPREELELEDELLVWPLFADNLVKAGYAGVGSVYALVDEDSRAFDADLRFEGERFGDAFVPYLRKVILEGGGIGPIGIDHAGTRLVKDLTRDLVAF